MMSVFDSAGRPWRAVLILFTGYGMAAVATAAIEAPTGAARAVALAVCGSSGAGHGLGARPTRAVPPTA